MSEKLTAEQVAYACHDEVRDTATGGRIAISPDKDGNTARYRDTIYSLPRATLS
jgi:hypothetical protein